MSAAVHLPSCRARPVAGILRDARSAPRCCLTHACSWPALASGDSLNVLNVGRYSLPHDSALVALDYHADPGRGGAAGRVGARDGGSDEYWAYLMAAAYAQVGETEEALSWLDHSITVRGWVDYVYFMRHDRCLESLRASRRFQELMATARERYARFTDDGTPAEE
jgi:hypothetical protein